MRLVSGIGNGSDINSASQAKQTPVMRHPHQLLLNLENRCLDIRSKGWSRRLTFLRIFWEAAGDSSIRAIR